MSKLPFKDRVWLKTFKRFQINYFYDSGGNNLLHPYSLRLQGDKSLSLTQPHGAHHITCTSPKYTPDQSQPNQNLTDSL